LIIMNPENFLPNQLNTSKCKKNLIVIRKTKLL
jgi:hypothetical protein